MTVFHNCKIYCCSYAFIYLFLVRFVKGCTPGDRTGFDIDASDLREMEEFHEVIVASAIFGIVDQKLYLRASF